MAIPVAGRITEQLRRSTVQIRSGKGRRQGGGSAIVLTGKRLLTNAHVIQEGQITVESWDGKSSFATVMKVERRHDLALLAAPELDAPPAELGDSDGLRVGMPVVAVGNPFGFVGAVSTGIIHSFGPVGPLGTQPWIQADLRLAPGNSGGPLADLQGRVIGINTMIVGGLAIAIPSRRVQSFLSRKHPAPLLGVRLQTVETPKHKQFGLLILELVPGGSAEAASLLPGDVLIAGDSRPFKSVDDLQDALENAEATFDLNFYRGDFERIRQVTVKLAPAKEVLAA